MPFLSFLILIGLSYRPTCCIHKFIKSSDQLDNELALGGRIYLAKDARQTAEMFKKTYPLYPKWKVLSLK